MKRNLSQLAGEVWAIERGALERIVGRVVSDATLPDDLFAPLTDEQRASVDAANAVRYVAVDDAVPALAERQAVTRPGPKSGNVAIVPVRGPLMKRDSLWTWLFGGTSYERLTATMQQLVADEAVATILLDVDSPGGTVSGIPECAAAIRSAAAVKNVEAISNDLCASAAYWLASQADGITATPEALTGSVGVFTMHEDWSRFWDATGITVTYIQAGRFKTEGNSDEPLSDEAKAHMQSIVDDAYRLFVDDVAAGRKVDAATVKSDYGEGRVLRSKDARAAGMVDRVAMFGETLSRLTGSKGQSATVAEGEQEREAETLAPINTARARSALWRLRTS